ncbi:MULTISPECIES: methylated-DNA--[protein]-cysteine S-methyltransferase [unclassified Desulfurobacterium]|uniref:methylated-DNA--[protein]-cysteine S-methyltransferase n=1 Tax=Desulfurobacterium sp. TC5-1 TaxID=1158318 RepID=UPI0003B55368|nr:methylated-DNA--[protein]-cysteine S-methyltransferase [Desulfurobacterium sp. TC5-1]
MITIVQFSFGVTVIVEHIDNTVTKVNLTAEKLVETEGHPLIVKRFQAYEKYGKVIVPFKKELLTPFQLKVFSTVTAIPPGKTATYGQIAKTLKTSPRAVGQALKRNPFPIIIPCHRVISSRNIGGFSAGISIKKLLLNFETNHFI